MCTRTLALIGLAGSFGALSVGGCGARAASRKTPIYFIFLWLSRSAERQYIKVQQDQRSSLNVARCRLIAIVGHTFKTSFLMAVLF